MKHIKNKIIFGIAMLPIIIFFAIQIDKDTQKLSAQGVTTEEKKDAVSPNSLGVPTGALGGQAAEFLGTLTAIKNIKIDTRILSTDSFRSLNDYTVTVLSENNNGRPNPFASIGQNDGRFPGYVNFQTVDVSVIQNQENADISVNQEYASEKSPMYIPSQGNPAVDILSQEGSQKNTTNKKIKTQ